jgi:dipeptidyl aminopeptidase/acylaminoacyl peptidase
MNDRRDDRERSPNRGPERPADCATKRTLLALLLLAFALLPRNALADATAPPVFAAYLEPDPEVTRLLTAPRTPEPLVHGASGRVALLERETVLPLDRLAQPWLGLAGFRFDPKTRTSGVKPLVSRVNIVSARVPGEALAVWRPSAGARLSDVRFAPDGRTLSAVWIGEGPARLALFDVESGTERRLDAPIQAAWGSPCAWVAKRALLCRMIPEPAGAAPSPRIEPDVAEHSGKPLPLRTYTNLLDDAHEDELFEYFFTSELARLDIDGTTTRIPQTRGLLSRVEPSPDGRHAVVTRIERPYSRMVPARRFPTVVEVWDLAGKRLYASPPKGLGVATDDQEDAPRRFAWRPGQPTTLGWIEQESTTEGPPPHVWLALEAPFTAATPREVARSESRIAQFGWTTAGTPLFVTRAEDASVDQIWAVRPDGTRMVWQGDSEDRYLRPGQALRVDGTEGPILEWKDRLFLTNDGLGPGGPEPRLEALHLDTLESETLFTSSPGVYEPAIAMLDPAVPAFVTSRETVTQAPQLFAIRGTERTALQPLPHPYPELEGTERRRVVYARPDGVDLAGTLYLPTGWAERAPLPTVIWIYPREFSQQAYAEQVDIRHFRFHEVRGVSPLVAVLRGYAVLVHPTMPIIGSKKTRNDAYLEQLAASAEAAVDHLVEIGVADPERVAIGGHSYGAFSAANLLIHTDRFATGLVSSGAYNRTLTPFGFQSEKRSLWKATAFYTAVSPFFHVDQLRAPILIVHGSADPNSGTPALQARRFFHALVGVGAQARYVEMPFEGHRPIARKSVLHIAAEILDWLDRTIGPKATADAPPASKP